MSPLDHLEQEKPSATVEAAPKPSEPLTSEGASLHSEARDSPSAEVRAQPTSAIQRAAQEKSEKQAGNELAQPQLSSGHLQDEFREQLTPDESEANVLNEAEAVVQRQYSGLRNNYVYAVGVLKPEFPNQGLREAFYSAAQDLNVSEYDYYKVLNHVNSSNHRPNFYIAEQIRWVLTIHDKDTYQLQPRSKAELMCFIQALKPPENSLLSVLSTAVGVIDDSASHANSSESDSDRLTKVVCNQLFSQTLDSLHDLLKKQTGVTTSVIQDVLKGLEYQPNQGRSNFSRAKNYLAYRYPELYLTTHTLQKEVNASETGYFLDEVHASYSDLASPHVIVDLTFTYKNKGRDNGLKPEIYLHCSVDVTHQFPFVNAPLQEFMPLTLMTS